MNPVKLLMQKHSFISLGLMSLAAILLAIGLTILIHPPEVAQAQFADLTAAQTQYSNIVGTALDACGLCHTATFGFNDYGLAYVTSGKDFAGIEGQDSDGDGFTNIEEIMALTFPGDASSKPSVPTPTPTPLPSGNVVVSISGPSSASVGDEFEVEIVAQGADVGSTIYGAQFKLNFAAANLQVIDGSLQPGTAMNPYVIAVSEVDNGTGIVQLAYSRQGDVAGLTGNVTLATLRFRATNATGGASFNLSESDLILGTKEADSIPISSITGLTVVIAQPGSNKATVSGQVSLPGKSNQSGTIVSLEGSGFSVTTDNGGNFNITAVNEGTYTVEASASGHLEAVCSGKTVSAPTTQLAPVSLISGDLNGDGLIDITDATTIGVDFGSGSTRSDLNGDGTINVLDLILLANNFGASGPSNWAC